MGRYLSDDLSISSDLINGSRVISINSQIITDTELDIRARDLNITLDLDESREFTMGNLRCQFLDWDIIVENVNVEADSVRKRLPIIFWIISLRLTT